MCFWRCLAGVNVIIGEKSGSEEDGQEGHDLERCISESAVV